MEWDVVLFSGIFRCHLYGNAVRFFAGYRSLHCMEKKKEAYPDYRKARDEMQELMKAQKNVEMFFAEEKDTAEKEPTR